MDLQKIFKQIEEIVSSSGADRFDQGYKSAADDMKMLIDHLDRQVCNIKKLSDLLSDDETDDEHFVDCLVCSNCGLEFTFSFRSSFASCSSPQQHGLHYCPSCGAIVKQRLL